MLRDRWIAGLRELSKKGPKEGLNVVAKTIPLANFVVQHIKKLRSTSILKVNFLAGGKGAGAGQSGTLLPASAGRPR